MDKADAKIQENQSDTSSVITMKEYASSEYPGSEPPPAYMKPRSVALRIAKLVAFTVIASSVILGSFILAASWIQANAARNLDLTLNQELLDDLQPGYEHLIAEEVLPDRANDNSVGNAAREKPETAGKDKEERNDEGLGLVPPPPPPPSTSDKKALELDEIANMLIQKSSKGNVNCIIERRRNEELVDHAPRSLDLPFGLNITTPPRLQHVTGEQMVVVCKNDDEEQSKEEEQKEENVQPMFNLNGIHPMSQIIRLPPMTQIPIQRFPPPRPQQQTIYHTPMVYQPREIPILPPQHPVQNAFDRRVPLEPMAVNDVPLSRMPLTHMPFRNEEESVPLQRLVPPHPQRYVTENFGREEPRFEPQIPQMFRNSPQFSRPRFPFPNREEDEERPAPVEGRFLRPSPMPFPSRRPEGTGNPLFGELRREPKIIRMIPLRVENVGSGFPGKRIRFPEGEEQTDRRMPLVAEITKIVPVGIEKEISDSNSVDDSEETQGFGGRPFPIPIDAILEAVLKGVGAAVNAGESSAPLPVDVKIERIEAEPMGKPSFFEKLEIVPKKPTRSEDSEPSGKPEPSTLMIDEVEKEKMSPSSENEKSETASKPIEAEKVTEAPASPTPDRSFLPDGTGRGAGVFPIPRGASEAEIFTVSDASAAGENGDAEIPVGFSVSVADSGAALSNPEGRRGKVMNFDRPVEGEINIFPQAEGRAMKPQPVRTSEEIRSRVFNIDDARSVRLYPVPPEKISEQEARPHYVQPRSV